MQSSPIKKKGEKHPQKQRALLRRQGHSSSLVLGVHCDPINTEPEAINNSAILSFNYASVFWWR
jgi:hypothetical protein